MNLYEHLRRQAAFSRATFGPGARTEGISDHIRKELQEVAEAVTAAERSKEWTDVAILGLDGLWRSCAEQLRDIGAGEPTNSEVAEMACRLIRDKQDRNEIRTWPDWRTADPNKAIEHNRKEGIQGFRSRRPLRDRKADGRLGMRDRSCKRCEYDANGCFFPVPQRGGTPPFMAQAVMPDDSEGGATCWQFRETVSETPDDRD